MVDRAGRWLPYALGVVLVTASRLLTFPVTPWELDEFLFLEGVLDFDPLRHHPHPPGYPLYIALGKLVNAFLHDPFASLVAIGVVSSILGCLVLARTLTCALGDAWIGTFGSVLFFMSPAMLVHSSLALADSAAVLFLILAFDAAAREILQPSESLRSIALFALYASASIGCRPQYAIAVVPTLFAILILSRNPKKAITALAVFTVGCLLWLVPLVHAVGGVGEWISYEATQAGYVATHDAAISRGGRSPLDLALRFVAHPWGPKWLSLPVLLLAGAGFVSLFRREAELPLRRFALVLTGFFAIHVGFSFEVTDPADGVRYVLPALIVVAFFAARGVAWLGSRLGAARVSSAVAALLFSAVTISYAWPVIRTRGVSPSPPFAAATEARASLPQNAVILYDLSLEAHAEYLMDAFQPQPIDSGLRRYAYRSEIPLYVYADGGSDVEGSKIYRWPASDAYGKLTRNHYRVVSLIPLPPENRFIPLDGVHPVERTIEGKAWRWLAPTATIELPAEGGSVTLRFGLPPEALQESVRVDVFLADEPSPRQVIVRRGGTAELSMNTPSTALPIRFRSSASYVPAAAGSSGDPRRLSVQLLDVRTSPR